MLPPLCVFALGLALMVAPLTATVLGAAPADRAGLASGVNNAVARAGSLFAVAALPVVVGLSGAEYDDAQAFSSAYSQAMWVCAALLVAGGCRVVVHDPRRSAGQAGRGRARERRPSWTARTAATDGLANYPSTMARGRPGIACAAVVVAALLLASCGNGSSEPTAGVVRRPGDDHVLVRPHDPDGPDVDADARPDARGRPNPGRSGRRCTPPTC